MQIWNDQKRLVNYKVVSVGRSLNFVVNDQTSRVETINVGILLELKNFLLYINNITKIVLRSFVNNYADNTTIYGWTLKTLFGRSFEADFSSDLSQQCPGKKIYQYPLHRDLTQNLHEYYEIYTTSQAPIIHLLKKI